MQNPIDNNNNYLSFIVYDIHLNEKNEIIFNKTAVTVKCTCQIQKIKHLMKAFLNIRFHLSLKLNF